MRTLLLKLRLRLFHPPYYRVLKSSNPENHLCFIERVEKSWGFTFIRDVSYGSDMFADSIVKAKNGTMRMLYGPHPVYDK